MPTAPRLAPPPGGYWPQMRYLTRITVTVAAFALLWIAGEWHRYNCIQSRNTHCSVLPWVSGEPVKSHR